MGTVPGTKQLRADATLLPHVTRVSADKVGGVSEGDRAPGISHPSPSRGHADPHPRTVPQASSGCGVGQAGCRRCSRAPPQPCAAGPDASAMLLRGWFPGAGTGSRAAAKGGGLSPGLPGTAWPRPSSPRGNTAGAESDPVPSVKCEHSTPSFSFWLTSLRKKPSSSSGIR